MFVRTWMTRDPTTVQPEEPVAAALQLMVKGSLRRLPVVEDEGRPVGLLSLAQALAAQKRDGCRTVADAMGKSPPVRVAPGEPLESFALTMLRRRRSVGLVVEHGRLVGIITGSDLFRGLASMLGADKGGARVTVDLPGDSEALLEAFSLVSAHGLELTSLAACEAIQGRRLVTVRVKGVKLDAFVEELWKIGGRVQQVTRPPESKRRAS